jgi:hypothetical protein
MCPAIDNPTSCEICAVHFLHAKNMSAAEIHHELCVVYGQNIMSEETVRQWRGIFKDRQVNKCSYGERSGQPSAVSDDLVQIVDKKNW